MDVNKNIMNRRKDWKYKKMYMRISHYCPLEFPTISCNEILISSVPSRALLTATMLSALEQSASGPLRYTIMWITSGKYLSYFSPHPRKIVWLIVFHCYPRAVCCLCERACTEKNTPMCTTELLVSFTCPAVSEIKNHATST